MRLQHAATLSEILSSSPLRDLAERAQELSQLQLSLSCVLDTRLQDQCRVLDFRNGVLTLGSPQAAVAAQLRYLAPAIVRRLRERPETAQLRTLKVVVIAALNYRPITPTSPHPLTDAARKALLDAARLQDDPELSLAFQRLASAGKPEKK